VKVWLNGALVEEEAVCISPSDHGFLLGDGVFETLRCYEGRPFALREHLERLHAGARAMGIGVPPLDDLEAGALALAATGGLSDARIRITVTSGAGPPGLGRGEGRPTVLMTARPSTGWPPTASAIVAGWAHDERSPLAGVKTVSRAESVVALMHARSRGADDAVFLNRGGHLCEATTANLFAVRDGRVETPALSSGCLAGITRERVLRLCAELGIEAGEVELARDVLRSADELFLTSSTREVQALVRVDGLQIAAGKAGPVTRRIGTAFSEMVHAELSP
jgi:branched-chain amino acid aminotransferase